jgi:hypothetical protein
VEANDIISCFFKDIVLQISKIILVLNKIFNFIMIVVFIGAKISLASLASQRRTHTSTRFQLSRLVCKNKSAPYTICHVRPYDLISGGDFSSIVSVSHMEDPLVAQNLG